MNIEKLFAKSPEFETERLLLRRLTLDDTEDYYAFASDPRVSEQTLWNCHETVDDSVQYIQRALDNYETKSVYLWGFVRKDTGHLIGRGGSFISMSLCRVLLWDMPLQARSGIKGLLLKRCSPSFITAFRNWTATGWRADAMLATSVRHGSWRNWACRMKVCFVSN